MNDFFFLRMSKNINDLQALEEDEEEGFMSSICCCFGNSKYGDNKFQNADDSVHVMIKHDKKKLSDKGEKVTGYVPRAPHPCLTGEVQPNNTEDGESKTEVAEEKKVEQPEQAGDS